MRLILSVFLIGILTIPSVSYAQEQQNNPLNDISKVEPTQIIPASPEAATLGSYGNTPVNLYSGTANVTIPIHTVQGRELSYPVSLSYSGAGGIKVEDVATWVGLGWSLSA